MARHSFRGIAGSFVGIVARSDFPIDAREEVLRSPTSTGMAADSTRKKRVFQISRELHGDHAYLTNCL